MAWSSSIRVVTTGGTEDSPKETTTKTPFVLRWKNNRCHFFHFTHTHKIQQKKDLVVISVVVAAFQEFNLALHLV